MMQEEHTRAMVPQGMASLRSGRRVAIAIGDALVFSVSGGPRAAASAREEIRERLVPKVGEEVVGVAQLLLSELINNCVLHGVAGGPEAWIDITVSTFPRSLWVEVTDGGRTFHHEPHAVSPEAESGRGLYLVQQLASHWGISDHGTARVWFEVPRLREEGAGYTSTDRRAL
jgi:anti-sigma regulatory factor (Ser/Thr protein kinase)